MRAPQGPGSSGPSAVAARVIEASWLVAVAVVPLLYDPHGALGFEPVKFVVFRSLGLLVGAMLLVRALDGFFRGVRRPPFWAVAAFLLWLSAAASCLVSIDPNRSVWGSPQMQQGLWTLSCSLIFFAGVATHLRTPDQRRRLVGAALAGSAPMAVYSLAQRMGLDRSGVSFAGHPLYLDGYLLLVMPLCIWRLWLANEEKKGIGPRILYGALLAVQFTAFMATQKRGPLVALVLASGAGMVLLAAVSGRFRFVRVALIACAVAFAGLVALAVMREAGVPMDNVPIAGRLSRTIPLGTRTTDLPRDTMWREALPLLTARNPVLLSDVSSDAWRAVRLWLGYGPETLQRLLIQRWEPHVLLPLAPAESRFHNSFWDTWQATGLLGVGACLAFFLAVFLAGCRAAGLLRESRSGIWSGVAATTGGTAAGAAMALACGIGYFGVGFVVGFAGGAVFHVFREARRRAEPQSAVGAGTALVIGLMVALIAHWIFLAFVFETGPTWALVWILAGAVVGARADEKSESAPSGDHLRMPAPAVGLVAGLMLAVVLNGLIHVRSAEALSVWQILRIALTTVPLTGTPTGLALIALAASGVAVCAILGDAPALRKRREFAIVSGIAIAAAFGAAWVKAAWLAEIGPIPGLHDPAGTALAQVRQLEWASPLVVGGCLACVVAIAAHPAAPAMWLLLAGAGAPAWWISLKPLRADTICGSGDFLLATGRFAAAAAVYDRALAVDPANDASRVQDAAALIEIAERGRNPADFPPLMARAAEVLETGRKMGWVNRGDLQLGRVYLRGALAETAANKKAALANLARDAFARATRLDPFSEPTWFEAAMADRLLFSDEAAADAKIEKITAITHPAENRKFDAATWGYYYADLSNEAASPSLRREYGSHALDYFERGLEEDGELAEGNRLSPEKKYRMLLAMGRVRRDVLRNPQTAVEDYRHAAETESELGTWEAEGRLAETYAAMGNSEEALRHVERSLEDAPPEVRPDLEKIRAALLKKP